MSVTPIPTCDCPMFNPVCFGDLPTGGVITPAWLSTHYLKFPLAQGAEAMLDTTIGGDLTINAGVVDSLGSSGTAGQILSSTGVNTVEWVPSGLLPLNPSPAGVYTNLNATINSYGQVTVASSGTAPTSFVLTSNAVGTNSWTFTIPISYGRAYSYSIYTDIQPTGTTTSNLAKPMVGYPAINGTFFFATGSGILVKYTSDSINAITYCSGFQQDYEIHSSGEAYIMSIINNMGATFTWAYSTNSVNDNAACPPQASSGFTTTYTLTSTGSVPACFVKLVGIVIAS